MEARKVQVKVFADAAHVDVSPLVPVFHEWIQKNALGEMLIDVTEYGHVHHGPALLLVGHASDYCIDFGEGRPGMLCNRKRQTAADVRSAVEDAVRRALAACRRLEADVPGLRFRGDELLLRFNDRLNAPNTDESLSAALPAIQDVLKKLYVGVAFTVAREGDGRELLTARVRAPGAPSVADLLARVS